MTLSTGLSIARLGLAANADQSSVVARNVTNANSASATRKVANVVTVFSGGARVAAISRSADEPLLLTLLDAKSQAATQSALVESLEKLDQTVADPDLASSPSSLIGKLQNAMQSYAASPTDVSAASSAITAAKRVAESLNSASDTVLTVRRNADDAIASSVDKLNTLLGRLEKLNLDIVKQTIAGNDVTDALDSRDQIVKDISEEVGVRVINRANNDMALYTDSGVVLFETRARSVTYDKTPNLTAGVTGNAVRIDGVPVTGPGAVMAAHAGAIVGLTQIRDEIAPRYQSQLDEIARGLITAFAESDQSATPTLPDATGLFNYVGGTTIPASGTIVNGLASIIGVSSAVDPSRGGDTKLLRDGGIAGAAYKYNTTGSQGYTARLQQLQDKLQSKMTFDTTAGAGSSASLTSYSASTVAWLQETRKTANSDSDYRTTLYQRADETLSKVSGVNIDDEMTTMLDLERSYQATSKLISTIDQMFQSIISAI